MIRDSLGSGTGTGAVQVNAGTLAGTGRIAGAVSVRTTPDLGAVLSPGVNGPGTLTIQGTLTLVNATTYKCELRTYNATVNRVVPKGISIVGFTNLAIFSFVSLSNATLPPGTVFTVINNTAATPLEAPSVNGESSTFTAGNNTFQANYQGGTGNDLTLTVQ